MHQTLQWYLKAVEHGSTTKIGHAICQLTASQDVPLGQNGMVDSAWIMATALSRSATLYATRSTIILQ